MWLSESIQFQELSRSSVEFVLVGVIGSCPYYVWYRFTETIAQYDNMYRLLECALYPTV